MFRVLSVFMVASTAGSALAAWEFKPEVDIRVAHDDNVQIAPEREVSSTIGLIEGRGRLRWFDRSSELGLYAGIRHTTYSDEQYDDESTRFLNVNAEIRRARYEVSMDGRYRRDSLLRTDVIGGLSDVGTIGDRDTSDNISNDIGVSDAQLNRDIFEVEPELAIKISSRMHLLVGYRYLEQKYEDSVLQDSFRDSTFSGANMAIMQSLTKKDVVSIRVSDHTLDPEIGQDVDTVEVIAGWERSFASGLRLDAALGYRDTDVGNGSKDSGAVFRLKADKELKRGHAAVLIERGTYPSSFGSLAERDRVQLSLSYRLGARWGLATTVSHVDTSLEASTQTGLIDDQKFTEFSQSLRYQVKPRFSVGMGFRARKVSKDAAVSDARGNMFYLFLSFRPR